MKIIQLHSENIKRVKVVDITPEGNCVIVSGMNENGKSSVIDSIWLALQYRSASKENPVPLRKGTDKGIITLDLGDYIVTRKFTENDSTLEVRTPDGSKITSPQKLLDGLIGDLSFDPWEFSRLSETQQRTMLSDLLFKLTNGKINLADYEARKQDAFEKRTDANREKKRLASLLTNIRPPTDKEPADEISITDLTISITDALKTNNSIDSIQSSIARHNKDIIEQEDLIEKAKRVVENLQKENQRLAETLSEIEIQDVTFLQSQLKDIESTNKRAREIKEYHKLRDSLTEVDKSINTLNEKMELIDIEKAEALESSPLPVKDMVVNADGIHVINEDGEEVPFCQANDARKLRISLAIAMASNPTLRIIRISNGSLLDDVSMKIVEEMAKDQDYQVWIEYASRNDQDRIGVYIEDGKLV